MLLTQSVVTPQIRRERVEYKSGAHSTGRRYDTKLMDG